MLFGYFLAEIGVHFLDPFLPLEAKQVAHAKEMLGELKKTVRSEILEPALDFVNAFKL